MQNRGGDGCPSPWPLGRLWERERVRALMGKGVESWRKLEFWKRIRILEIGNSFGLGRKERKIEKGKRKRI